MRMKILAPVTAGVLLAMAGTANAATKSANFTVTATVAKNCLISATNLAFGAFDGDVDVNGTSTVNVRCTNGTQYTVRLSAGGPTGTFAARRMTNGSNYLVYNLYTEAAYTNIWGDGTTGNVNVSGTGSGIGGAGTTTTVHGRIQASANTHAFDAGSYTDTIVASVVY